jgi:predicted RNase H-like HicB family nuclease
MNLPLQPTPPIPWHLLLETLADGKITAWVAELPDCRIVADTREAAIAQLDASLEQRLGAIEVVPSSLPSPQPTEQPLPINDLPSLPQNDPYWLELMAELRASRQLEEDNPAYTSNW